MSNHQSRQHVSTGSPYEPRLGISRAVAVRPGRVIAVAGTAPLGPDGRTVAKGDPAAQARRCLEIIRNALEQLSASLTDVTRTRILLTRITKEGGLPAGLAVIVSVGKGHDRW